MAIEIDYTQTTWVNEETRLNAQNMNNIDRAIMSIKQSLDNKEFTAQSVGADPAGSATNAVSEHNDSDSAHETTLAKKVHTHTLSQITDFPSNTPTDADNGKVAMVKNHSWVADKLTFSDIDGELPYADISGAPSIPTKTSQLENDSGFVSRNEIDQPAMIEYPGGQTANIILDFNYSPDHLIIDDYASGSSTPVTTVVDRNYSGTATFYWNDLNVTIVSPIGGEFNQSGHTYKVWAYALPDATQLTDGDVVVVEGGKWSYKSPEEMGFTAVEANPEDSASHDLTKVKIGDVVYDVVGEVDSAMSSTSTNPVENRVVYNQLAGKEATANKATNFNTLNNTKFPTTQAVANYLTAQISANSASTPTDTLENIKIGSDIFAVPNESDLLTLTTSNFSDNGDLYNFKFKVTADDISAINAKVTANEKFTVVFSLDTVADGEMHIDAFATVGRTFNNFLYFTGVARISRVATQVLNEETVPFQMTYKASDEYPFKLCFAFAVGIQSGSELPVQSGAVYTALQGKEATANKATDFSTINNVKFPTTQAVSNYIKGNPTGQTSTTDLNYLRIGNDLYRIPSGSSITVDDAMSSTSTNPVQNKVINSQISTLTGNVTTLMTSVSAQASLISTLSAQKQNISNLVTSVSSSSTDTQYPSAKCLFNRANVKAIELFSGTTPLDDLPVTLSSTPQAGDIIEVHMTTSVYGAVNVISGCGRVPSSGSYVITCPFWNSSQSVLQGIALTFNGNSLTTSNISHGSIFLYRIYAYRIQN